MKKIMYISTASNISGATLSFLTVINGVRSKGVEPVVVTAERGPLEELLQQQGFKTYKLLFKSWLYGHGELRTIKGKVKRTVKSALEHYAEYRMFNIMRRENPDALHINTGMSPVGIKSAKKLGIPVIWHLREIPDVYWGRVPDSPQREREMLRSANAVIAISQYVYQEYSGKTPDNINVIYNCIDTSSFEKARVKLPFSDALIRLSLCGYDEFKGHRQAIEALSFLKDDGFNNLELNFYGNIRQPYKESLVSMAREMNVLDSVKFRGHTQDMASVWGSTDIALMCSTCEAFGRVTVEAMAAGALVIGADAGATPELLAEDRGLLYKSGDAKSLATTISWAIGNVEKSREIADGGRQYVKTGAFSVERYMNALFELYRSVCA